VYVSDKIVLNNGFLTFPNIPKNTIIIITRHSTWLPAAHHHELTFPLLPVTMTIQTRITELLNIEHPIVMGGMTGVGTVELAAAVSNAGGLGMFAAHNACSPEGCRQWIRQMKRLVNDKPFGVNLTILPTMGTPPPYHEYAQVIIDEGVKVVETAGSNPKVFIQAFKKAGIITIHKCVTIRHALSAQRMGVDIIS